MESDALRIGEARPSAVDAGDCPFDVPALIPWPGHVTRFHAQLELGEDTGHELGPCWLWVGKRISTNGYGRYYFRGEETAAHRFSYELHVGPVGANKELDHKCARWNPELRLSVVNRRCCNPNHLEPVLPRVNNLLSNGAAALNARKTHCKNGHPLSGPGSDVCIKSGGKRECRVCRRAHQSPNKWGGVVRGDAAGKEEEDRRGAERADGRGEPEG